MSISLELTTSSPQETQAVGRLLGQQAQAGDIFLLSGELGTGKTTLTQGIAWGLGVAEHARSPTFVLMAQYQGRLTLHHIDLYRVDTVEEALELGLDDYLFGQGVCVVEWAEKAPQAFPADHLSVQLHYVGEMTRRLALVPRGQRYESLLQVVAESLKG
jgi:tRNA threonylcarbamoyladenosine biosynthesis protein TsaE